MGKEIERKFLVDREQWEALPKPHGIMIKQGYLLNNKQCAVRVRVTEKQGWITIKGDEGNAVSRSEFEYEIPKSDAEALMDKFAANGTEKIRYCIPQGELSWEVDVFIGANEGLIVAEIELQDEAQYFDKPAWVKQEVTADRRYANSNLSLHPYSQW